MYEAKRKDAILNKTSRASVSLALHLPGPVQFALICDTEDRRGTIRSYNYQIRVAEDASRLEPHYHTS